MIAQTELVKELGLPSTNMTAIRKKHLASADWFKEGNSVYLTAEGVFKLRLWWENRDDNPGVVPEFIECRVHSPCPNHNRVWIIVDHGPKGKLKEECAIPRRLHSRLTKGKPITVEVVRDVTGVSYRHEDLATGY